MLHNSEYTFAAHLDKVKDALVAVHEYQCLNVNIADLKAQQLIADKHITICNEFFLQESNRCLIRNTSLNHKQADMHGTDGIVRPLCPMKYGR